MLIPEDGCLPPITRKGFAAFNNVMLIRVPENLRKPNESCFQLATMDRSKKGERWPADKYVDNIMNMLTQESSSAKNTNSNDDNISNSQKSNAREKATFLPKKCKPIARCDVFSQNSQNQAERCSTPPNSTDTANFNHRFLPKTFNDSQGPCTEFPGEESINFNDRNFNDNTHAYRYHSNTFSSDRQPYGRLPGSLRGEGSSFNHNRYGVTNNATITREPPSRNGPYDNDFESLDPPNNQHNLMISPTKPPFVDFGRNPPLFPDPFMNNPQQSVFNRTNISNSHFIDGNRRAEESFIPNSYDTNNYPPENLRNGNFEREAFSYNHPNRPEFINNNGCFNMPPFQESGVNHGFNENPRNGFPLLPAPPPPLLPNDAMNRNFENNFHRRNRRFDQKGWNNRNQPNSRYNRKGGNERNYKSWRGQRPNKFLKGNNNTKRENNRHERKKSA